MDQNDFSKVTDTLIIVASGLFILEMSILKVQLLPKSLFHETTLS